MAFRLAPSELPQILLKYYDYRLFASRVTVKEIDEPGQSLLNQPGTMKIITLTIFILIATTQAFAQKEACVTDRNAPPVNAYYWPPDTAVKVYFVRDMFTAEQRTTLLAAMKTWSEGSANAGAGISFTYAGESDELSRCESCLTVTRKEVNKKSRKHYAFFNPMKQDQDGLLVSAWIDFDFATTSPHALQGFMAHELGHGMGLLDCDNCKKKKTIMNGFPAINKNNGLVEPSDCDLEVVRKVYELHRQVENNTVVPKP